MAKMAHYFFSRDGEYNVVGFTVDQRYNDKRPMCGFEVCDFERVESIYPPSIHDIFVAIGPSQMNSLRERKCCEAVSKGYRLASYISTRAVCDSPVGDNCFVGDMVVINPFVNIGSNNFFYEGAIISNDSNIGNNCYFSPRCYVGTFCCVMDNAILGAGAVLKSSVIVEKKTLVGAAAYISANTKEGGVYGERNSGFYGCISDKVNIS